MRGSAPIQPKLKREEWDWAYGYLHAMVEDQHDRKRVYLTFRCQSDPAQVAQLIVDLQARPYGRELIRKFSNSLRQHRYRCRTKDRKTCTFMLTKEAKKALAAQAKHIGRTESDYLSELVTDSSAQAAVYQRREQRLQAGLAAERDLRQQAEELGQARHAQAMLQIEKLATLLSTWELAMEMLTPELTVDKELLKKEVMKKVKAVQDAISNAEAFHNMKSLTYVGLSPFSGSKSFI